MRLLMQRMTLLFLLITVIIAMVTMGLSWQADNSKSEVTALEKQIKDVKLLIRVLEGEWSQLNRPQRLKRLADQHLDIEKASAYNQIDYISQLPTRKEVADLKIKQREILNQKDYVKEEKVTLDKQDVNDGKEAAKHKEELLKEQNILKEREDYINREEIKLSEELEAAQDPIDNLLSEINELKKDKIDPIEELIERE